MATSSIGRPVVIDDKRARRLAEILSKPQARAHSVSGKKLVLSRVSDLGADAKSIR